jgi:gluconolactonase
MTGTSLHRRCLPALFAAACLSSLNPATPATADQPAIPGLGPTGPIQRLHGELQFTEGPAWDGRSSLYFTDIPANRIYKRDGQGQLSVFVEPSRHANGLFFNARGNLVACEMDGRLVEIDVQTRGVTPLAVKFEGQRFNAPNDLVIDRDGGIYFTDPRYRAPEPWPQGKEAFYYRAPDGTVTRLGDGLSAPNGILLSPDEETLYVVPSLQKQVMAYPVREPGVVGGGRIFCELQQRQPDGNSGGDGLTVDMQGNLYITTGLGLQVFSPQGEKLGIIEFPEQPANVTFGGPERRTLFVTARTALYAAPMKVAGHAFPAGRQADRSSAGDDAGGRP